MCSSLLATLPYWTLPHESGEVGRLLSSFRAGALNKAGEIRLFTYGKARLICRPAVLQPGAVTAVKSPESIWAVGTNAMVVAGAERLVVVCSPIKKKSLFLL